MPPFASKTPACGSRDAGWSAAWHRTGSRIELASLPVERDEARLLYCMGWETANMHFGSAQAIAKVKRDLAARRGRWLHKAAKSMFKVTLEDWAQWRLGWKKHMPKTS